MSKTMEVLPVMGSGLASISENRASGNRMMFEGGGGGGGPSGAMTVGELPQISTKGPRSMWSVRSKEAKITFSATGRSRVVEQREVPAEFREDLLPIFETKREHEESFSGGGGPSKDRTVDSMTSMSVQSMGSPDHSAHGSDSEAPEQDDDDSDDSHDDPMMERMYHNLTNMWTQPPASGMAAEPEDARASHSPKLRLHKQGKQGGAGEGPAPFALKEVLAPVKGLLQNGQGDAALKLVQALLATQHKKHLVDYEAERFKTHLAAFDQQLVTLGRQPRVKAAGAE
eukprot:TRINITY_DN11111_c0_g1_i1.p1 TRINITY_DN11111_c0_g1~~TRINITY_DN11111_c0_g1_i1.p1  ORF type:complete len:285 (+),score=70.21 TRINITY_DN11111_c0_g1_i1:214-1068(+)